MNYDKHCVELYIYGTTYHGAAECRPLKTSLMSVSLRIAHNKVLRFCIPVSAVFLIFEFSIISV
jgi:hypothetical protein